ncbi:MAG: exodeoxyribonuclease VII small subunit [Rhodospirillaceae bacterium]|nr:exodeoxyribonuclease VII small subunit [Rhodospirillaceae bacterium]
MPADKTQAQRDQADVAALSFEQAMKELEDIVRKLESGQVKLDEAVTAYERGAALKKHCESKLAEAKTKVEKITGSGKSIGLEPDGQD